MSSQAKPTARKSQYWTNPEEPRKHEHLKLLPFMATLNIIVQKMGTLDI